MESHLVGLVPAPGTKIFLGLTQPQAMSRDALVREARQISRDREFHYELADAIAGFEDAKSETARGGAVLRD